AALAPVAGCTVAATALAGLNFWWRARNTVYAITDRRGLIVPPLGRAQTLPLARLRGFQRVQNDVGGGDLLPPVGNSGEGFYGVRNVKDVDDLIKGRAVRDRSTEVLPAAPPEGRGDELAASGE